MLFHISVSVLLADWEEVDGKLGYTDFPVT
jgi:hypothetical protein